MDEWLHHLDTILPIMATLGGVIYFVVKMNTAIGNLTENVKELTLQVSKMHNIFHSLDSRITILETKCKAWHDDK
jgi:prefoldin subunit 5